MGGRQQGKFLSKKKNKGSFLYIATILFSVLFLFIGNQIATENLTIFENNEFEQTVVKAQVTEITERTTEENTLEENPTAENVEILFQATILNGEQKGETVQARQYMDSTYSAGAQEVQLGDKILILHNEGQEEAIWDYVDVLRSDHLLVFGILFILALLLFGRMKGFNTILSLLFTCTAIFAVFIPSILSGKDIYIVSVVICCYVIIMTCLIVNGSNKKSLAAMFGCFGGMLVSGILTIGMGEILALTGYVDEQSIFLTYVSTDTPIDLKAIIFAAILIGAMGAIMDVSMSISSSLWEVKEQSHAPSFHTLFKSGMNIGRDVMGTMANTLILAYIGSSLSVVLLLSAYSTSFLYLMNREMIIVEVLQALVGSFGILFTMPLTSLICAVLYAKRNHKANRSSKSKALH